MILRRALASLVFLLALVFSAVSPLAWEPPRGSPVRSAIMDGLRPVVERDLGPPVLFNVVALNVEGPWAFVSVRATRPGGQPVDWSRTRYARAMASGQMSESILALMRGDGQMWSVVEYALGPTDVPWEGWVSRHRLSRGLFEGAYASAGPQNQGAAPPPPPPPPPQPPVATMPQPVAPPVAQSPAGMRRWTLGDISFETPAHWQSLDSAQADLSIGGDAWNTTLSDRPMDTGRGVMLVFSWSDDEFIYSRSLDQTNLLGTQASRLSGIPARKIYFSLRDRYNDARGFDVVSTAEVQGGTLSMGCRAPNAQWASIEATCERILASVRVAVQAPPAVAATPSQPVAPPPPVPSQPAQPAQPDPPQTVEPIGDAPPAQGSEPAPVAQPQKPQPVQPPAGAPQDAAFRHFTTAIEKLEAYETSKAHADWQAGLEAAQQAVELQPTIADYWRILGYAYALGGSEIQLASALAEEAYEKSIAIDPKNTGSRMLLAALLLERQSFSRALDNIEAALSVKPELATSPVVADMCRIYLVDEQLARGEKYFAKFVAANPRSHAARLGHAILLNDLKRTAEALPLVERIARDPQAPQTDAEHAKALLKEWQR